MALQDPLKNSGARLSSRLITAIDLLLLLLLAATLSLYAQEPEVIRVRTDLVAVPLIVTDSRGRRIADLKAAEFAIRDDRGPLKVDYFASGADRVALLFALDASGSARDIFTQQREAAMALFARFGQGSRVAVLHFGDFVRLTVPFTINIEAVQDSFNSTVKTNSGTAIFDAAAAAVRSFDGSGGFSTERRIVILMSDGLDTLSSTSYKKIIDIARARGVSFYVIHFPLFMPSEGRLVPRPPAKGFRELADETGGGYFRIGDAKDALNPHAKVDLAPVFQAIDRDLKGQYVLGFYPSELARDGQAHPVSVSLANRNGKLRINQLKTSYNLKTDP